MSAQQDAALRGASLAFQNQKPKQPPGGGDPAHPPSTPKNNGALLAATSASRDHSISASRDTSPPRGNLSRANSGRPTPQPQQRTISRQTTGGSSVQDWGARSPDQTAATAAQKLSQFLSSPSSATATSPYLLPPGGRPSADTRSASFIAATLAASRSASPSPNHTGTSPGYNAGQNRPVLYRERRGSIGASSVASSTASLDLPDTSNIAPTNSLISMFEDKKTDARTSRRKDGSPGRGGLGPTPKLRPPTPERELSPKREAVRPEPKAAPKPKPKPKPKEKPRAVTPPPQIVRRAATEIVSPEPRRIEQRIKLPPPSPPPTRTATVSQKPRVDKSTDSRGKPATKVAPNVKPPRPRVTPLVLSTNAVGKAGLESTTGSAPRPTTAKSASSDDTFVSASSMQSPRSPSTRSLQDLPMQQADRTWARPAPKPKPKPLSRPTTPGAVSRPTTPKPRRPPSARIPSNPSPTRSTFQQQIPDSSVLTLDSLTSAIVAGNLASARHTPKPLSRTPPPIPAPRHRHKKISPHHSGRQGMRQTLRQPASKSDDEDARRRKRALEGRKKHTHHEGTRRRWRDEIYEREKKRYEAVWASNRGLFLVPHPSHPAHFQLVELPPTTLRDGEDLSEHVANVVVRDIWSRSRLPEDELAEVWDLVDRGRKGMLNKQEFVVGMWLIDQRLRGRKIPARVSSSVWDSVKGVRVPGPGVKGK